MPERRPTRQVTVGNVPVGGGAPVSVQSMTKTPTEDVEATVSQIKELAELGCEIIRVAVPSRNAAAALSHIVEGSPVPVVADIHFSAGLAVQAIEAGVDAVRINPGNTEGSDCIERIAEAALKHSVPVRVGTNSGSVGADGHSDPAVRLVDVCLECCSALEDAGLKDIIVSFKSSSCEETVRAYRMAADMCDYPFHVGVTATGPSEQGIIRSAMGIGALLLDGIGDTIRVSLTGPPHREIPVAREIIAAAGLRTFGPEVISCPTCGRCGIDVDSLAREVQERTRDLPAGLKIAVMGCEVNGPGEASEADIGVAGAGQDAFLFCKGVKKEKIDASRAADMLVEEAKKLGLEKK